MKSSVYCLVRTDAQANRIVKGLHDAGISEHEISLLRPDQESKRDFANREHTKAPEGIIMGGALGWIVGMGALAIPGVGLFMAAGPILSALSGVAIGAAVGGIAGGLIGLGIPEHMAKRYEGKIRSGHIMLLVHVHNKMDIETVSGIYRDAGSVENSSANETLA